MLADLSDLRSSTAEIREAVQRQLADYTGPKLDSKACLARALEIMVLAYQASRMKHLAEGRLEKWIQEDNG